MSKKEQIVDILRVEGINSQGYGQSPKLVMRDKRLDLEAKAIYCYIASFTGGGNTAFPSRDIMLADLKISKDRYYKYFNQLKDADYIRVERKKSEKGAFEHNIYTLVMMPNPVAKENAEEAAVSDRRASESAGKQSRPKRFSVQNRASVNELRQRLQIEMLKAEDALNAELIEDVFMVIEDMNSSEQIKVAGTVKKKEAIESIISQLTTDHVRLVVDAVNNYKKPLTSPKAFIQTCLVNSIFDIRKQKIEPQNTISQTSKILNAEEQKQIEELKLKAEREEAYITYPEFKELDDQLENLMRKLARAILSPDEVTTKKLQKQAEELKNKRSEFIKNKGLKATI